MTCNFIQYDINEWKEEVIFKNVSIQYLIINAHLKFSIIFFHYREYPINNLY
jgi:hypothetical protein